MFRGLGKRRWPTALLPSPSAGCNPPLLLHDSQARPCALSSGHTGQHRSRPAFGRGGAGRKLALAGLLWVGLALTSSAATVSAQVEPDDVHVGDTVTFSLIFEGGAPEGSPGLPSLPGLTILPGISQRTEVTIQNTQQTIRYIYQYSLVPTQPGEITIPPLRVRVGNQWLTSSPVKLRVRPPDAEPRRETAPVFLKLVVAKTNCYLGEAVPVEMQLYWRERIEDVRYPQLKAEGFVLGRALTPSETIRRVGPYEYRVALFKSVVTPAKAGLLTLGPAECSLSVMIPVQTGRRDFFDPFGFFGPRVRAQPTVLTSEPVLMRVLPLPAGPVPPGFNGAVGQFNLHVSASPTTVAVGDPITVRVEVSGQGPIETLNLPSQPQWTNLFNAYPPTSTVELTDPLGLAGTKVFTNVLVPLRPDITALPPLQFSFFDPVEGRYRTLTGPAIALTVRPATVAATTLPPQTNATGSRDQEPPPEDILHIKSRLDDLASGRPPLVQRGWFMALQAAPVLAWASLWMRRRRIEALAQNPRLRRARQAARQLRDGLRQLRQQAAAHQTDAFFATLFRLLQEQLGALLDLPASAITEAVIDERLRPMGLPEPVLIELHALFQACNLARYAPADTRPDLMALLGRFEVVASQLQQRHL